MRGVPLRLIVIAAVAMMSSACGKSSTSPDGAATYAGQWSGTTSQGRPITFTVSSDQKVTAISVGYNFNGCVGTQTFSNLNLDIGSPPSPAPSLGPSFGYGSGSPEAPNYTQVLGSFTSSTSAVGSVIFGSYTGCGTAGANWTAAKR